MKNIGTENYIRIDEFEVLISDENELKYLTKVLEDSYEAQLIPLGGEKYRIKAKSDFGMTMQVIYSIAYLTGYSEALNKTL